MKLESSGIIRSPDAKGRDVVFVHRYGSQVFPQVFPLGMYDKTDGSKVQFDPEAMEEICNILRQRIERRKVTGKIAISKNAIGKNTTFELIGDRVIVGSLVWKVEDFEETLFLLGYDV